MKSSSRPDDLIQLGKITGAHGIRGVVKVYAYAESTSDFDLYDEFILIDPNGRQQKYKRLWAKPHQKQIVRLALERVTSRDRAEALTGCQVTIPRKHLPPLEDDSYYWVDLIGMAVQTADGEPLGNVEGIIRTGANDVYVVKTPDGHPVDEILLPAITSVILDIDIDRQLMLVELPEGLI